LSASKLAANSTEDIGTRARILYLSNRKPTYLIKTAMAVVSKGLEGIVAAETRLGEVNGAEGILYYWQGQL
jgi:hypothetical protein